MGITRKFKNEHGAWVKDHIETASDRRANERIRRRGIREPVGTALANRIEGLIGIRSGKGCDCKDLARKMDSWGIAGCEKRRTDIVATLVNHRDVLSAALKSEGHWIMAAAADHAPHVVLSLGAGRLLDLAIADIREGRVSPVKPSTRTPSVKPVAQGTRSPRPRRRGIGGAFSFGKGPIRFVTSAQFQRDILSLIAQIPPDITAIAGVARSGLSAATMLSMYLHLPMITIRQTMHDIVDTGNGWRLGGSHHIDPKKGKILVVDDTVMTGNSLKAIEPLIRSQVGQAVYAAIYVNPNATKKPDIWAVDLPWPHILEWNVFNSILSPSAAMDFDGILCRDCPHGSDDDGPKYLEFIRNAGPLYVPRRCPVPLIVTARIEKYRAETEAWLRRHGIAWHKLVMHPAKTLRERERDNIPAYKAKHYKAWASKHQPAPGPVMFFESEDRQAREIARLSGMLTVCPHTAGVYL
jgi:adenine/guanine phosphoribosyltransferase-like PRPP-binding protein